MLNGAGKDIFREQPGDHLASGESCERKWLNELLRRFGHHSLHCEPAFLQQARQLSGFVCRDTATHAEYDVHG